MKTIQFNPIGIIHSPFKEAKGTPIQTKAAKDIEGYLEIFQDYEKGLKDIDGFSHLILIYYFHLVKKYALEVKPFMDDNIHGVFSTRAPKRPNPIGLSVVRFVKLEKNIVYIKDVDMVDGTPLLDIKPYVPEFDIKKVTNIGWLQKNIYKLEASKDDGRFLS